MLSALADMSTRRHTHRPTRRPIRLPTRGLNRRSSCRSRHGARTSCSREDLWPGTAEQGAVTVFVVLFTVALLAVAGLVIDGGYALGAKRQAMNHAEQAARAGADALDPAALRDGRTVVDGSRAADAAQQYLALVGARGTVDVVGGEVTVTVTSRQDTTMLSAVGVTSIPISASATALSIDADD